MKIQIPYQHSLKNVLRKHQPARKTLRRKQILRSNETPSASRLITNEITIWNVLQNFSDSIERMLPYQYYKM